jgi:hypothetical protein
MASGLGDPGFEAGNGATTADGLPWQPGPRGMAGCS